MKRGVVYIAMGAPEHAAYSAASILSLHDFGYKGPISVFTDLPLYFDKLKRENVEVVQVNVPKGFQRPSRWVKTRLAQLSPYEETLYLDADTVGLSSIDKIWSYLSKGEIAVCLDINPMLADAKHSSLKEYVYTLKRYSPASIQYNCGVMLWKRSKSVLRLFNEWHKEWQRFGDIDQLAFTRAVQNTGVVPVELPAIFNWNERRNIHELPSLYHCMHMKQKLNSHFPGLYRRAASLTGVNVPSPVVLFMKYIMHMPRSVLRKCARWFAGKRLQKLASRNFAHRYKNL